MTRFGRQHVDLTPAQALWAELFGLRGIPELDERKVLEMVDSLPERRRLVVRLHFGFGKRRPLSQEAIGKRLPRAGGGTGVSREIVRRELDKALSELRRPRLKRAWMEAREEPDG